MTTFWIAFWIVTWFGSSSWGLWFLWTKGDGSEIPTRTHVAMTPLFFLLGPFVLMVMCNVLYIRYLNALVEADNRRKNERFNPHYLNFTESPCPQPSSPKSPT